MSHRYEQVGRELMRGISEIIREEMPLDRFGLITITEVDVGPGYESAKVFFTTLKKGEETKDLLNKRRGWFQKMLQKKIVLRRIPELHFHHDERSDHYNRIEALIEAEEKKKEKQ